MQLNAHILTLPHASTMSDTKNKSLVETLKQVDPQSNGKPLQLRKQKPEKKREKKKKKTNTKSECNSLKSCGDEHCQLFIRKQQREPNMWSLNMLLHASSGLFQVSDSLGCYVGRSVLSVMLLSSRCSTSPEHD